MRCFTVSKDKLSEWIDTERLPVDDTVDNRKMTNLKVVALMPDRDNIDPEHEFRHSIERASACSKIVFSASDNLSEDSRILISYNPREWCLDKESQHGDMEGAVLVFRSRDAFIAILGTDGILMQSMNGMKRIVKKGNGIALEDNDKIPIVIPEPDDGWFIATMD